MTVDLHIHTTASDGTATPGEVVGEAQRIGLPVIAITDHDSVQGVAAAMTAAAALPLEVLPGVELSAAVNGSRDVHILGYFIDFTSPTLLDTLRDLRERRLERAREMVDALSAAGFGVTLEGVLAHAGEGAVGRSHIARALVEAGDVDSVEIAFRTLIGRGERFFVEKRLLSASRAVAVIREAGGVGVLAHPGVSRADDLVDDLVASGLGGIEVYHADHAPEERARYAAVARRLGLVATGGSDYHGPATRSSRLGSGECPDHAVVALRERAASGG